MEQYTGQLKEFKEYMLKVYDVLAHENTDRESIELFYNSDFKIEFRGKTVTLHNGADAFNSIIEILEKEIDEND